jgi:CHASE3 domain sensor protein
VSDAPSGGLLPVSRGQRALALTLAGFVALAVAGVSESAYHLASDSLAALRARQTIRFETASLLRFLNAAESSQRGYLLLGRDDYLKPMVARRADIEALLVKLRTYYAEGDWALQVDELSRSVQQKYAELDETVRLYRLGSHSAWQALMETDIGREKMDAVRAASERLIAYEGERILVDRQAVGRALMLGRFGVHLLTLLSLIGLVVFLRKNASLAKAQKQHARELQQERDRLDTEVLRRTQQLTELAGHLQTVREDERAHLARELHDELGALLTTAKLDRLGAAAAHAQGRAP